MSSRRQLRDARTEVALRQEEEHRIALLQVGLQVGN